MHAVAALLASLAALRTAHAAASTWAGATSIDVYPPASATADYAPDFPSWEEVGYLGPTPTGAEPEAIATAPAFAKITDAFPLVASAQAPAAAPPFNIAQTWGNLAPMESTDADALGLPGTSPLVPAGCNLTQVHLLHRHGARYPTSGGYPANLGAVLQDAVHGGGFTASGPLAFLNTWSYKLGAEILTPFGRQQLFQLGSTFRVRYGHLLNGFDQLPVWRTTSEDRMVDSALHFAAGFFGVRTYAEDYYQSIIIENSGFNNTLAPYGTCSNNNVDAIGYYGDAIVDEWAEIYLKDAIARLQGYVKGLTLNATTVYAMQQLCAYETVSLGYSEFCGAFTEEEWRGFEYSIDLSFWYNSGPGNPTSASIGLGYAEELVSRLTHQPITVWDSATNSTLDSNPITFPLYQPIYVDASHDTIISAILTAMNFTTLAKNGPLPATEIPKNQTYFVNQIAPFGSNLVGQVLSCPASSTPTHIRFILNDAVIPLTGVEGCAYDKDGRCPLDTYIKGMQARIAQINYAHDCFANYTVPTPDTIVDGRYPPWLIK